MHVPASLAAFYGEVMQRKGRSPRVAQQRHNQLLHLVSSSVFFYCYPSLAFDLTTAMCLGLAALFVRQFGHAVLDHACHDKEMTLLGYNTRNKTLIVLGYTLIPLVRARRRRDRDAQVFGGGALPAIAEPLVVPDLVVISVAWGSWMEIQLQDLDDLVRQTRHRPANRHLRVFPAPFSVREASHLPGTLNGRTHERVAGVLRRLSLLSLERLAYVLIWRDPARLQEMVDAPRLSPHPRPNRPARSCCSPEFKVIQIAVFVGWHLALGDGTYCGPPHAIPA